MLEDFETPERECINKDNIIEIKSATFVWGVPSSTSKDKNRISMDSEIRKSPKGL